MDANRLGNKSAEYRLGFAILKWIASGVGIFFVLWAIYRNVSTLALLAVSFLLSYMLDPLITKLESKGLSRTLSIALILGIFTVALVSLLLFLTPKITHQAKKLFPDTTISSLQNPVSPIDSSTAISEMDTVEKTKFESWFDTHVNPVLIELGYQPLQREDLQLRIRELFDWVDFHYPQWSQSVLNAFQSMFTGVANFIVGILNFLLVPVFTFYLLRDYPSIGQSFYVLLPPAWRVPVADWMRELDCVVGGFIRGQFSIALILAAINAFGLTWIGVPFGFFIGVIAGLANMVPYMSIVVGLIPALLLSFLDRPDLWRLIWVLAIFCGAQMLEGFYLSPRIMGKEVGLHPVLIMLAIIVGGSLFGLLGIIFAVPMAAVVKVIASRWHTAWKERWVAEV